MFFEVRQNKKTSEDIPIWILHKSIDTISPYIKQYVDSMMDTCIFPSSLKSAEFQIHKREMLLTKVTN